MSVLTVERLAGTGLSRGRRDACRRLVLLGPTVLWWLGPAVTPFQALRSATGCVSPLSGHSKWQTVSGDVPGLTVRGATTPT